MKWLKIRGTKNSCVKRNYLQILRYTVWGHQVRIQKEWKQLAAQPSRSGSSQKQSSEPLRCSALFRRGHEHGRERNQKQIHKVHKVPLKTENPKPMWRIGTRYRDEEKGGFWGLILTVGFRVFRDEDAFVMGFYTATIKHILFFRWAIV